MEVRSNVSSPAILPRLIKPASLISVSARLRYFKFASGGQVFQSGVGDIGVHKIQPLEIGQIGDERQGVIDAGLVEIEFFEVSRPGQVRKSRAG